jgi:hypothetical protein
MKKMLSFSALRATIFLLVALVILVGAATYGFSNPLLAHGPNPPPDDPAAMPPPGSQLLAHGPNPPPDDPAAMPPPGSQSLIARQVSA